METICTRSTTSRCCRSLLALTLALAPVGALAADEPTEVVRRTGDRVLAVLADKSLSSDARREKVEDIVLDTVDFPTLCRLVLARHWSRFSPEQQKAFQDEFQKHLAHTYGRRLDQYGNEKVEIIGDRKEANGDWTVRSKILRGSAGADVSIDYRLRETNGQWKIIDFIVEQVSLVANFRSQFQEILANGDPERLLAMLREKTAKGEEFKQS